jgi:23S rRNA pseudouridine1911/1915/1917 synthase
MTDKTLINADELFDDGGTDGEIGEIGEQSCIVVGEDRGGERLDKFISDEEGISRSLAVKLIEDGRVSVGGKERGKNYKLSPLDEILISYPAPKSCEILPEEIALDVVYEDGDIIVINKPSGMIVHPATGIYSGTLVNALLYHCRDSLSGIGGVVRPGIVHRIDKDTSGLLVVAKNDEAHLSLSEQMKTHDVSRIYHALAVGNIKDDAGTINRPIGRHPTDRKKMAVITDPSRKSREAITHFEVMERFVTPKERFTYVKCKLETGRTHQIRVHMASIGHALMGDAVYGHVSTDFERTNKQIIQGQCLHAKCLELTHPKTREQMHFECDLPTDMQKVIEKLTALSRND